MLVTATNSYAKVSAETVYNSAYSDVDFAQTQQTNFSSAYMSFHCVCCMPHNFKRKWLSSKKTLYAISFLL